tara:strand:- start:1641 stop:2573 length:933 start_codon:yes stop_codon:yes gene_type:complete
MKNKRIKLSETQMARLVEMNASERIKLNNKGKANQDIPMRPVKETTTTSGAFAGKTKVNEKCGPGYTEKELQEAGCGDYGSKRGKEVARKRGVGRVRELNLTNNAPNIGRTRVKETSHVENNTRKGGNKTGAKKFKKTNDRVRAMQEQKKTKGGDANSAIKWLADYKRKNSSKKGIKESIRKALLKEEEECNIDLNLGAGGANAGCPSEGGGGPYGTCVRNATDWGTHCEAIMPTGGGNPGGTGMSMDPIGQTMGGDGIGGVNTNPQLKKRMRKMSRNPKGQVKGSMNRSQTDKMRMRPYKSKHNRMGLR